MDELARRNASLDVIKNTFLLSPIDNVELYVNRMISNKDGSYSIFVSSIDNLQQWKHTIKTEEI